MINRGDIKLAIDMVVNAQDDIMWGGEAEYVINTLEDCGNEISKLREQVAAQAAAVESLRDALSVVMWFVPNHLTVPENKRRFDILKAALAIPTDSPRFWQRCDGQSGNGFIK